MELQYSPLQGCCEDYVNKGESVPSTCQAEWLFINVSVTPSLCARQEDRALPQHQPLHPAAPPPPRSPAAKHLPQPFPLSLAIVQVVWWPGAPLLWGIGEKKGRTVRSTCPVCCHSSPPGLGARLVRELPLFLLRVLRIISSFKSRDPVH